jgi:hypothetical protein
MATYSLSPLFNGWQGFNAAGQPLNLGTIEIYLAGTNTPTPTYTTSTGAIQNSNPIVLNNGFPPNQIWMQDGVPLKFVVKDAAGSTINTYDNIQSSLSLLADTSNVANGDALVGVKRISTGGPGITLHQWIEGQVFSAVEFNVVADGVTDNTSTMQAAINAAEAVISTGSGGGRPSILLPSGVILTGTLTISKRLRIVGQGSGTTFIKLKSGVTTSLFVVNAENVGGGTIDDANHNMFEGMTLEGNRTVDVLTLGVSHGIYCPDTSWSISTQYSTAIRANDFVILNFTGDGFHFGANRNWALLYGCIVRYVNGNALSSYAYDHRITSCDFGLATRYNVRLFAGGGVKFTGCNIYYCNPSDVAVSATEGYNVLIDPFVNSYVQFDGCDNDYSHKVGLYVNAPDAAVKVVGGRFYGNSRAAANTYSDIVAAGADGTTSVTNASFVYAVQKSKYLIETVSTPKVIWRDNDYSAQTSDVPYGTGICNAPQSLLGNIFEPQGLVPSSNAAAAANTLIIQACIDAASIGGGVSVGGGLVQLPAGTYFTTRLLMKPGVTLRGAGEASTRLKLANTTNTDLLADVNYTTNVAFASNPYSVQAMTLDGNNSNNTSGNCMVAMTYWSIFRDVTFELAAQNGCIVATKTANGTDSANGVADTRFENCHFRGNKRSGVLCTNSTTNKLADVFFVGCTFNGNGESGYYQAVVERGSGFVFEECRFYSGYQGDIDITKFDRMTINACNFELNVLSAPNTSTIFANIRIRSISGFGDCTITSNFFYLSATVATATDVYCALYFDVASTAGTVVAGNSFVAEAVTVKRAVHGASACAGIIWPNGFRGYSAGTEYGTAWANWTRTAAGAAATDLASVIILANNIRTELQARGVMS